MATNCSVCLENYTREHNPPISCVPCGHIVCRPCLQYWLSKNNSCPECRQRVNSQMINRPLLDLIEGNTNTDNSNIPNNMIENNSNQLFRFDTLTLEICYRLTFGIYWIYLHGHL